MLDQYRQEFRSDYDRVVDKIREALTLSVSGRPAKSTAAIVDKLKRGSMRLSQMQDVAGCRVIVADSIEQAETVERLLQMFPATLVDRRLRPSHGYRAVHVVVRPVRRPIEIQVRTRLQHLWAELSEKAADTFGIDLKYGGGDPRVRVALDQSSELVARFEKLDVRRAAHHDQFRTQLELIRQEIEMNLQKLIAIFEHSR